LHRNQLKNIAFSTLNPYPTKVTDIALFSFIPIIHLLSYSNPKWFVEAHPEGVRFHKPRKSTNDLGQQEGKLWGKVGKLPYKAKRIVS
jgi:hypothetical protein